MPPLSTALFDYALPERAIAQLPAEHRDASRLLVVDRATRRLAHRRFADLPAYIHATDIIFRNNAAVLPARLAAVRPTGGAVECLLLRPAGTAEESWWCLLRPGKKLPVGATFAAPDNAFHATVREKRDDGTARVAFTTADLGGITAVANRLGRMPLQPYITRDATDTRSPADHERYQTVYADRARQVAVAAPTAGLHFTPELLATLAAAGATFAEVTLHVGLGTFRPIATAHIEDHPIHREIYELPVATQIALFRPPGRRIAVGTTTVRSVEDFLATHDAPRPAPHVAEAGLYIYPPRPFRGVDALITNFHQPRSTLLCLLAAFLTPASTEGIAWFKDIYAEALAHDYRFLSYGDAMLIL